MSTRFEPIPMASHTPIHGDGERPIERVRRLDHEWELTEYEWDPKTGEGRCSYERVLPSCDAFLTRAERTETNIAHYPQPSGRWHGGWRMWNGRFTTKRS
jgi:hypothetical protein